MRPRREETGRDMADGTRDDRTIDAIHNRIDLLENQVARLERLLEGQALGTGRPLEITVERDERPSAIPAAPIRLHQQSALRPGSAAAMPWRSPLVAGVSMLLAALLAVEVLG